MNLVLKRISSSSPFTSLLTKASKYFRTLKKIKVLSTLKSRCANAVCIPILSERDSTIHIRGESKNIKTVVPIALKRKFATPTLLACRFSLREATRAVMLDPRFAPSIIGIATSIGIRPVCASITVIPVVTELEWIIPVNRALIK